MGRVRMHVRHCGRLTSGSGRGNGSRLTGGPGCGVCSKRGLPASLHGCLSLHPGAQRDQCAAGARIMGASLLK